MKFLKYVLTHIICCKLFEILFRFNLKYVYVEIVKSGNGISIISLSSSDLIEFILYVLILKKERKFKFVTILLELAAFSLIQIW